MDKNKEAIKAIGQKVRQIRQHKKISQSALATKAGVSVKTVQRMENGQALTKILIALSIFDALNLSFSSLMDSARAGMKKISKIKRINTVFHI